MRYIEEELLTLEEAEHIINTLLQLTKASCLLDIPEFYPHTQVQSP